MTPHFKPTHIAIMKNSSNPFRQSPASADVFDKALSPWWRQRRIAAIRIRCALWRAAARAFDVVKRGFDISASIILLILLSPVFVTIAMLIKLDGGPAFFPQTRVGLRGRTFKMYKFRSMCVNAETRLKELLAQNELGSDLRFKMKNDPRITRIGRIIRGTSLDELPQLLNVLRGEMSLVGPRPPVPREVDLYTLKDRRRLEHKPGITCLWQVGERDGGFWQIGSRNKIDFAEQVELDVRYIESRSFLRDLWILVKTVPAMVLGK